MIQRTLAVPSEGSVDDVIITEELSHRPSRPPDYQAENRALTALAQAMADSPETLLQKLVDMALDLCRAGSAGVSIEENDVFRWRATAGAFASYCGGTMPRDFSPCGTVLERNIALLMTAPDRFFPYMAALHPHAAEVLLIPFYRGDAPIGTVWVVSHSERQFDAEDQRLVTSLSGFASAATEAARITAELRDADRKKDDFIALLAHELRNPLAPIRNGMQILRLAGGDIAAITQARAMMDRQLGHMVRLIDDLLDTSRISRNKMELRRQRVLLADVVASAVETARPLIEAADHDLNLSLPIGPVFLDADLTRLAQVFSNLLTNSAKYTERGGKIRLSAVCRAGEVVVTVRDNGLGIPANALASIFDMFRQVDRGVERSTGGLGIGLALVKGLVEMHGGTVSAASEGEGKGSTFTVRLPVMDGRSIPPMPAVEDKEGRGSCRRVMVVDDNRDGAASMAMMIRLMGDEVRTAHNGIEAMEMAETFRPEIILMDVGMPHLNGLEATRRIRQQPWGKAITIIALTGWGQDGDKERSRQAGCDGHLVKPVDLPDLEKLLRAARD